MKIFLTISFWIAAVSFTAAVFVSFGYSYAESFMISTLFLPGALAVNFFFPTVSFRDKAAGIKNVAVIILAVIVAEILLMIVVNMIIWRIREWFNIAYTPPADVLTNPFFIAIITAVLAFGGFFFEKWLDNVFPTVRGPVTFLSERKAISLDIQEILFVESNDSITIVYATGNRQYRNTTSISQWGMTLGNDFIRIHRSYLVNKSFIDAVEYDGVTIGGYELPVSRKYKDSVLQLK